MDDQLRADADRIIAASLKAVMPDQAVQRALADFHSEGKTLLVAAGKAAWQMAKAAVAVLGRVDDGVVITKYGHVKGELPGIACYEAGHPVPDENGFAATEKALVMTAGLSERDTVLFLLSGGGSALFEKPLLPGGELQDVTGQLLACGADIVETNTIRKRFSGVKGGRFALHCAPARVFSIVLSDILGDPLDMIASGPAYPDTSNANQELKIKETKAAARRPKICKSRPESERTIEAVCRLVKRFNQLKKHSIGCRTELTKVEKASPERMVSDLRFLRGVITKIADSSRSEFAHSLSI